MAEVTVSPKYQIVIPKEIRAALRIKPGQKLAVSSDGREIYLNPVRPIEELRDLLAEFNPTAPPFERDKSDRPLPGGTRIPRRRR